MTNNYNSYAFLYMNGELSEQDNHLLESQDSFMKKIIKRSKDKKYYFKSSDNVKKDEAFISELIDIFKDDHEFLRILGDEYERLNDYNSEDTMEVVVKLSNVYEETHDELLIDFNDRAKSYFKSVMSDILHEIMAVEDYDDRKALGEGFQLTDMTFHFSPVIKEFIAKKMTSELLLNHPLLSFEELVHYAGIPLSNIKDREREFIFGYIGSQDKALADYLGIHPELIDEYIPMVKESEKNWNKYLKKLNREKTKTIYNEMNRYIEEKNLDKDSIELYRGIVDLTNNKDKIYKYSDFKDEPYKKVNLAKMSIPELRFVRYMTQYIDEVFDIDVPYEDMEDITGYDDIIEEKDGKIISLGVFKKRRNRR